jgi:hypothetical protein
LCTCRKIDASSLMGLYTAAWDRHKKNKRDRGTAVVGISDDGTLIYEVQCNAKHAIVR